jgi:hypothetical protein
MQGSSRRPDTFVNGRLSVIKPQSGRGALPYPARRVGTVSAGFDTLSANVARTDRSRSGR